MMKHPYHQLASLLTRAPQSRPGPDAILFGLTPNRATLTAKIASKNHPRQRFMPLVRDLIGGCTKVLVSSKEGTKMEMIGNGHSLDGLTLTIHLLCRRPNCLVMDGAFNCCRPYAMIVQYLLITSIVQYIAQHIRQRVDSDYFRVQPIGNDRFLSSI
jgi:hypothetical protein